MSHPVLTLGTLFVAAYLLGSIPFSQVFARLHGIDLRRVGTGNVGASNLSRPAGEVGGLLLLSVILLVRRMQGNPGSERGFRPVLRRAMFDVENPADAVEAADDLLTP
ncbi:MAG: glycerol-3-phosphate acyltransferase [Acidimicrobiia bacterium]